MGTAIWRVHQAQGDALGGKLPPQKRAGKMPKLEAKMSAQVMRMGEPEQAAAHLACPLGS